MINVPICIIHAFFLISILPNRKAYFQKSINQNIVTIIIMVTIKIKPENRIDGFLNSPIFNLDFLVFWIGVFFELMVFMCTLEIECLPKKFISNLYQNQLEVILFLYNFTCFHYQRKWFGCWSFVIDELGTLKRFVLIYVVVDSWMNDCFYGTTWLIKCLREEYKRWRKVCSRLFIETTML